MPLVQGGRAAEDFVLPLVLHGGRGLHGDPLAQAVQHVGQQQAGCAMRRGQGLHHVLHGFAGRAVRTVRRDVPGVGEMLLGQRQRTAQAAHDAQQLPALSKIAPQGDGGLERLAQVLKIPCGFAQGGQQFGRFERKGEDAPPDGGLAALRIRQGDVAQHLQQQRILYPRRERRAVLSGVAGGRHELAAHAAEQADVRQRGDIAFGPQRGEDLALLEVAPALGKGRGKLPPGPFVAAQILVPESGEVLPHAVIAAADGQDVVQRVVHHVITAGRIGRRDARVLLIARRDFLPELGKADAGRGQVDVDALFHVVQQGDLVARYGQIQQGAQARGQRALHLVVRHPVQREEVELGGDHVPVFLFADQREDLHARRFLDAAGTHLFGDHVAQPAYLHDGIVIAGPVLRRDGLHEVRMQAVAQRGHDPGIGLLHEMLLAPAFGMFQHVQAEGGQQPALAGLLQLQGIEHLRIQLLDLRVAGDAFGGRRGEREHVPLIDGAGHEQGAGEKRDQEPGAQQPQPRGGQEGQPSAERTGKALRGQETRKILRGKGGRPAFFGQGRAKAEMQAAQRAEGLMGHRRAQRGQQAAEPGAQLPEGMQRVQGIPLRGHAVPGLFVQAGFQHVRRPPGRLGQLLFGPLQQQARRLARHAVGQQAHESVHARQGVQIAHQHEDRAGTAAAEQELLHGIGQGHAARGQAVFIPGLEAAGRHHQHDALEGIAGPLPGCQFQQRGPVLAVAIRGGAFQHHGRTQEMPAQRRALLGGNGLARPPEQGGAAVAVQGEEPRLAVAQGLMEARRRGDHDAHALPPGVRQAARRRQREAGARLFAEDLADEDLFVVPAQEEAHRHQQDGAGDQAQQDDRARGQRPAHPPCQHRQQAQHQDEQHQPERYFQYLAQSLHSFLSLRAVMPGRGTASVALVPLRRCPASLLLPLVDARRGRDGGPFPPDNQRRASTDPGRGQNCGNGILASSAAHNAPNNSTTRGGTSM